MAQRRKAGTERFKAWEFQLQLSLFAGLLEKALQLSFSLCLDSLQKRLSVIVILMEEWPQLTLTVDTKHFGVGVGS